MLGGGVEVWTKNILYWFINGQIHLGMPRRGAKMSLALNELKLVATHSSSNTSYQVWTTSGKKLLILAANNQWEIMGD